MEMDMKVIEQLVAQALKEMKAEEPAAFVKPKEETYGVFATMDEAIEASAKAQKTLLFSKIEDRQRYVDIIRATILRRENCCLTRCSPHRYGLLLHLAYLLRWR